MATPLHRRPGVTVRQISERRQQLLTELHSPEHIGRVITRGYGEHDPRIAPFPACSCGAPAKLALLNSGKWHVRCSSCTRAIADPQKSDWGACLQWCAINKEQLDYRELPLFDLKELDSQASKVRLTSIYNDLMLRCQIATLDQALSERTHEHPSPGRDYMEKICAYRDWAKLALSLIKLSSEAQPE